MPTLFYCPGSCSLASQIALEEAGVAHALGFVNLNGDRTDYYRINPAGKVPALLLDGELLTENIAILTWAALQAPEKNLLPADPMARIRAYSFMAWGTSSVHIARRQFRAPHRFTPDEAAHPALQAVGREAFWAALRQIDERLAGGEWIGGAEFSVCDGYALVFYDWGLRDEHPMDSLQAYTRFADRMTQRPAVLKALETHRSPLVRR
ncbi:glutathione S-transferase N-terminal domain-containing protein [Emcibacter sp. SYSU 3D8]|uniref:glutathione S-transferase family protein n=1 Tax=Emcibacter sp. SYSU 3D8 TaxID=3133969 RepID=UPI0031FE8294